MSPRSFFLHTIAVAVGTLAALAISGLYVKSQLSSATSGNSTIGTILSLFGPKPAASSGS